MNKKKNEGNSDYMKLKPKKLSKSEMNTRVNYNNDDGNNIIENILKINKIKRNSLKTNEEFKENINKDFDSNKNLLLNDYLQPGDFKYINIIKTMKIYNPDIFKLLPNSNNYRMIINIIVDDDSLNSTNDLLKIIKLIESSLKSLNQIKITINKFLICIFFQHLSHESSFKHLFPGLKFYNFIKSDNFYCSLGQYSSKNKLNILLLYKEASTFVQIYKFFYTQLLPDLYIFQPEQNDRNILVVNWPNGKIFKEKNKKNSKKKTGIGDYFNSQNFLKNVLKICGNKNIILIPDIKFVPHKDDKVFGFMNKFCLENDKIKINLHWYIICGYPIDHRFFFVNMNYKLFSVLQNFYQKEAKEFCNEYYHDYQLVIYLKQSMENIEIQKLLDIEVEYSDLPWNLAYYFHDLMLRRGSENANFFNLLYYFSLCKNCNFKLFLKKIFLFFKLLNDFMQFFWLGITFLISYAVFNDTFGSEGNNMDYFCSLGYVIMIIILLSISLLYIRNEPNIKDNKITRINKLKKSGHKILLVLYIIHYFYFFFFIICALIAIIHIKQGKYTDINDSEYYALNVNAFLIILFSNVFIYFLPSFFRFSNIISRGFIFNFFLYLPCASTFFNYPALFTCIKTKNSKKKKFESLYTTFFVVLNGFVTVVCLVFDTTRQRRMNFLSVMGIIISVLNAIKLIISVFGTCFINRFKNDYLKYLKENKDDDIGVFEDYGYKDNNEDSKQNNVLTNNNFINDENNNNNNIKEEKSYEIENNNKDINEENNKDNIQFEESNNKNSLKEINIKRSYTSDNIAKKNNNSKNDIETSSKNLENYPMDTTKTNVEIKPDKVEIKNNLNNSNNSEKKNLNGQENYPHDNTQSFSLQNSSFDDPNPGILNEKDLEENGA